MMNIQTKAIPATGLAAAAAMGIALATCAPAMAAPNLVGMGCADYASLHPDGPASVSGMSQDPVAVAASNNPELTTLTAAVSGQLNPQVNLVDTLNSGQYTVFAPTDAAFNKLPASTIDELKTNSDMLTKILTYHVVAGRVTPAELASGKTLKTLEGGTVTPAMMGSSYTVNGASVVCGNVQTANATVYIIGSVLMPK